MLRITGFLDFGEKQVALSMEAAEAVIGGYLNGRVLPISVHKALVLVIRARLIDGDVPVLEEKLCTIIDQEAHGSPPPDEEIVNSPVNGLKDAQS